MVMHRNICGRGTGQPQHYMAERLVLKVPPPSRSLDFSNDTEPFRNAGPYDRLYHLGPVSMVIASRSAITPLAYLKSLPPFVALRRILLAADPNI